MTKPIKYRVELRMPPHLYDKMYKEAKNLGFSHNAFMNMILSEWQPKGKK